MSSWSAVLTLVAVMWLIALMIGGRVRVKRSYYAGVAALTLAAVTAPAVYNLVFPERTITRTEALNTLDTSSSAGDSQKPYYDLDTRGGQQVVVYKHTRPLGSIGEQHIPADKVRVETFEDGTEEPRMEARYTVRPVHLIGGNITAESACVQGVDTGCQANTRHTDVTYVLHVPASSHHNENH